MGLLLPCNVTVSQVEDGVTEVALVDPLAMLGVVANLELEPIAEEARGIGRNARRARDRGEHTRAGRDVPSDIACHLSFSPLLSLRHETSAAAPC